VKATIAQRTRGTRAMLTCTTLKLIFYLSCTVIKRMTVALGLVCCLCSYLPCPVDVVRAVMHSYLLYRLGVLLSRIIEKSLLGSPELPVRLPRPVRYGLGVIHSSSASSARSRGQRKNGDCDRRSLSWYQWPSNIVYSHRPPKCTFMAWESYI
jgi:hypothetical protein